MEKGKFNFINFGRALGRSEMKKLMAGSGSSGGCSETLNCPNGYTATCTSESGYCHVENNGTCDGYLNCGTGTVQVGCWMHDPNCT